MSSRKFPIDPYGKQISAPLPAPNTSSAVNYVQIPENVMWLSDDRGFMKRPGSLPFTTITPPTSTALNWVSALLRVQTPSYAQGGIFTSDAAETGRVYDQYSVLAYRSSVPISGGGKTVSSDSRFGGVVPLRHYNAGTVGTTSYISRAPYDRADASYYLRTSVTESAVLTLADTTNMAEVIAVADAPTTTLNGFSQLASPALSSTPVRYPYERSTARQSLGSTLPFSTPTGVFMAAAPVGGSYTYPPMSAGIGRIDTASNETGAFIGGGGGTILHWDGYRTHVAGTMPISSVAGNGYSIVATAGGVGALTGVYQYFITHVVRLPSGEVIESGPTPVATSTPAAQSVSLQYAVGDGFSLELYSTLGAGSVPMVQNAFRTDAFRTSTTAGTVVTLSAWSGGPDSDLQVGETAHFYPTAGALARTHFSRRIVARTATTITLDSALPAGLAGTTAVSSGGSARLYRTKAGGSVFYVLGEFAFSEIDSFTTGYTDNALDATLTVQYADTATTREPPPSVVHSICAHQGRVVALASSQDPFYSNSSLYNLFSVSVTSGQPCTRYTAKASAPFFSFSSATSKHYFPPSQYVSLPNVEGQTACAVVSKDNTLYLFLSGSVFYVTGSLDDSVSYTVNTLSSQVGCLDPASVCVVDQFIYFNSTRGLARISGTQIDLDFAEPVQKYVKQATSTACYVWKAQDLLLVSANAMTLSTVYSSNGLLTSQLSAANRNYADYDPAFYTTDTARTLVLDLSTGKWAAWNIDCYSGAVEIEGELLCLPAVKANSQAPVTVLRMSDRCNWTDTGVPFTARYYSEWYDAGVPAVDKSFNRAQIFSTDTTEAGGQGFKLTVRTERDWQPGLTVDTFTDLTDFKVDHGYGEQAYDSQPYGDPELSEKVLPLSNQKAKSLRLVIENSEPNRNIAINAASIEINPKYVNMKDE